MKNDIKSRGPFVWHTLVVWSAGLLISFPILWVILTSFKTELEAAQFPPSILRFRWTFDNYRTVLTDQAYLNYALNSVIESGGATFLAIVLALPAAWALAFIPSNSNRGILFWMLSTKMLPPVGVLMPIFLIYRNLGLLDSRIGLLLILAATNLPIIIWMIHSYFRDVPREILEAARMDGASFLREMVSVLMPLAAPGIASAALLSIILAWNESFWSLNLSGTNAAPLTAFIASFSSPQGLFWARLSAASILAILPIVLIGWACQRQLVRGLTFGAVK